MDLHNDEWICLLYTNNWMSRTAVSESERKKKQIRSPKSCSLLTFVTKSLVGERLGLVIRQNNSHFLSIERAHYTWTGVNFGSCKCNSSPTLWKYWWHWETIIMILIKISKLVCGLLCFCHRLKNASYSSTPHYFLLPYFQLTLFGSCIFTNLYVLPSSYVAVSFSVFRCCYFKDIY